MRSPSPKLIELLNRHALCTSRDVTDCEPFVRRLCQDLPDFDSVWLDALVQKRILTSWQAEVLQSGDPDRIRSGKFTLRERLGQRTFLAVDPARQPFVLESLHSADAPTDSFRTPGSRKTPDSSHSHPAGRIYELIRTITAHSPAAPDCLSLPITISTDTNVESVTGPVYAVSRYVEGWPLDELLIRGGRMLWQTVAEIGRDLLTALAWLESVRMLHGDLVLRNARITTSGRVVLTSAFVRRMRQPHVALSDRLSLRDCDGIAPEQLGSGRPADVRTELYSLGCLLWQLLSSRPVVLTADPVTRLVKLREQDVTDVRTFVPDCPEWMARLIQSMTRRTPDLRPSAVSEILKPWKAAATGGSAHSRILVRQMPDRAARSKAAKVRRSSRRWPRFWLPTATAALAVVVATGAQLGLMPKTLRLGAPSTWFHTQQTAAPVKAESGTASNEAMAAQLNALNLTAEKAPAIELPGGPSGIRPMPAPDQNGVVRLTAGAEYLATDFSHTSPVQIETIATPENAEAATILVPRGQAWHIRSPAIVLTGLTIRMIPADAAVSLQSVSGTESQAALSAFAMISVVTDVLTATSCTLRNLPDAREQAAIGWEEGNTPSATISVRNCVFLGGGHAVRLGRPPAACQFSNVLLATTAAALRCDIAETASQRLHLEMNRVTQRFGHSLTDIVVRSPNATAVRFELVCGESVFAPTAAVLRLAVPSGTGVNDFFADFRLPETGNPALVPSGIETAIWYDAGLKTFVRISDQQIQTESLLITHPVFRDSEMDSTVPKADSIAGSELIDFEGPKLTTSMPGIDRALLPPDLNRPKSVP